MRLLAVALFAACTPVSEIEMPDDSGLDTGLTPDPECVTAEDCDDGNPCTGEETCSPEGSCVPGEPVVCEAPTTCIVDMGEAVCEVVCDLPRAPVLDVVRPEDALVFSGIDVQTAVIAVDGDPEDAAWADTDTVDLAGESGLVRVLARSLAEDCDPDERFDHIYDVRATYPGAVDSPDDVSIPSDDPAIVGWATSVEDVVYGEAVDKTWRVPDNALGPAEGTSTDVLVLGRGGQVTLAFDPPIADGPGFDLAVFENSFSDGFLELGFIEVSSDGSTFVRFDSAANTPKKVGPFGEVDASSIHGFGGAHRQGFGTPFDLSWLRFHPDARSGQLDLQAVAYVRVVDVVGDGSDLDAFGRPIFDPYPTSGSAGFDLDAVGVLNPAGL
ncbi:MAG: hypothetical protein AAGA48_37095 [Myxococcota bacterium]